MALPSPSGDLAALQRFNIALAAVVAELVESYENQGLSRVEAVFLAGRWQHSYLTVVHGTPDPPAGS